MKERILTLCIPLLALYFRYAPDGLFSVAIWKRFCVPYVNWRGLEVTATVQFGARFRCSTCDLIQSFLIYFGIWEPSLTAYIRRSLTPGDVFVDVGANIGYFSLLASRLVGAEGGVVAIEASPANYARLQANLNLNSDCGNVRLVNVAVSNKDAVLNIYSGGPSNTGATSTLSTHQRKFEAQVPARPLDGILTEQERRRCRLVKIDVEGAELPILRNVISTIGAYSEDVEFVVEISPDDIRDLGGSTEEIFEQFRRLRFFAYELHNDYRVESYLRPGAVVAPVRMTQPPHAQTDVVFSRRNVEML